MLRESASDIINQYMEELNGLAIIDVADRSTWRTWLAKHHGQTEGVWVKLAKKNKGVSSVSYSEALEEAMCYGWIDGQIQKYSEQFYLQRFTPRRPKSVWSKVNTEKAEALIAAGRMQPAGLAVVQSAKDDGRWEAAYLSSSNMVIPDDFAAALAAQPKAKAFFDTLNKLNQYAYYYRIQSQRTPIGRAKKIEQYVAMLARGEKLHP